MLGSLRRGRRVRGRLVAPIKTGAFLHRDVSVRGGLSPVRGRKGGGVQVFVSVMAEAKTKKKPARFVCDLTN